MTSQRQVEANRRNAARSTGPKTAASRAISSKNSRKHGLYADPPADLVHALYCLIVGDPEANIALQSRSNFELASLQLAEAEARLCLVRKIDTDRATASEKAIDRRSKGASVDAKPIYRASKKMRRLSQKKLDRAMCGDISVVPTESLPIYVPYWQSMKRAGFFDSGRTELTPTLGLMLYSEHLIDAVDNAGRGKLPRDNLRIRAQLEGTRSRALTKWLKTFAADQNLPQSTTEPRNRARETFEGLSSWTE
jgi:hypothetical protein